MRRSSGFAARFLVAVSAATMVAVQAASPGLAGEKEFPYEQELLLDARPMKGSKRVPMMEVMRRGDSKIDLWCNSVPAQFVIVEDTITIVTGAKSNQLCAPERGRGDEELLATLLSITHWQRNGDVLTLRGPKGLRFRASTH
jgi:heat shock protein HslJ